MRLLALLLLTACTNSPAPSMWGAQSQTASLNNRDYTIWWTSADFEIIRHGWASPSQHQQIRADMLTLVPQVTGCTMLDAAVTGDSGEMHGPLTC